MLAFAISAAFSADMKVIVPMLAAQPERIYRSLAAEGWADDETRDL